MKTALLFNLEEEKELIPLLLSEKIKSVSVAPLEHNQKLGYLLNNSKYKKESKEIKTFKDKMIVFSGLSDEDLNRVLKALRQANILIPLKSIVTPYNIEWSAFDLRQELMKEHLMMQRSLKK